MRDALLEPLDAILRSTEALLAITDLEDLTYKCVGDIYASADQLRAMVISLPNLTWDNAKMVLSYEVRTHAATIMGYAEALLDGDYGDLPLYYEAHMQAIWSDCKQLLARLSRIWE